MILPVGPADVVAFDLDDTLYAEVDFVRSGLRAVDDLLQSLGHGSHLATMSAAFGRRAPIFDALCASQPHLATLKERMLRTYREHAPRLTPARAGHTLLHQIRRAGGRLALLTDGRSSTQRRKLHALGFARAFDLVVISEEIGHTKPAPEGYRHIMEALPAARYTYIADNPRKDFVVPSALGWRSICILDDGAHVHRQPELRSPQVDYVAGLATIEVHAVAAMAEARP